MTPEMKVQWLFDLQKVAPMTSKPACHIWEDQDKRYEASLYTHKYEFNKSINFLKIRWNMITYQKPTGQLSVLDL